MGASTIRRKIRTLTSHLARGGQVIPCGLYYFLTKQWP
ncbi:hypothetical protein ADILRU_0195 [Leifsonia rubra CMS 76R]|nr:hypothetical protein ADILRU_0195 [Leifsonia rubra CMS 76R]